MGEPEDFGYYDDDTCQHCDGEGYYHHCWDGCCIDSDVGCDACTRRCTVCNPLTPAEQAKADELRKVLADALAVTTPHTGEG